MYHITVSQQTGEQVMKVTVNGVAQEDNIITLKDDALEHDVQVMLITE